MRVSREAQRVRVAQAEVAVELSRMQEAKDLSDIEMLQAVNTWQGTALKYMLRAERGDPDRPADLA